MKLKSNASETLLAVMESHQDMDIMDRILVKIGNPESLVRGGREGRREGKKGGRERGREGGEGEREGGRGRRERGREGGEGVGWREKVCLKESYRNLINLPLPCIFSAQICLVGLNELTREVLVS